MNIISYKDVVKCLYSHCSDDKLIFQVPEDYPDIKVESGWNYVTCPTCNKLCLLEWKDQCQDLVWKFCHRPTEAIPIMNTVIMRQTIQDMRQTIQDLERRLSIVEYSAPHGPEFQKILQEAQAAGDFTD